MGKQAPAATSREIQLEIYYLHLALSRAPGELAQLAGLLQLNQVVTRRGLNLTEGSLCLALSATRLRLLAWPAHCRAELSAIWDQVSNAARRHVAPARLVGVLQLVHMASQVATVMPPDGRLEKLYEQSSSSSSSWTGGAGTGVWSSPPEQKFLTRTTGDW